METISQGCQNVFQSFITWNAPKMTMLLLWGFKLLSIFTQSSMFVSDCFKGMIWQKASHGVKDQGPSKPQHTDNNRTKYIKFNVRTARFLSQRSGCYNKLHPFKTSLSTNHGEKGIKALNSSSSLPFYTNLISNE